jgi:hypothetical protein
MKSLASLHITVLENLGQLCSTDVARDVETTSRRWKDEGDSYLTIVLPRLGKALEKGLADGQWPAHMVNSTWDHHGGLPAYLRGFLSRVFDRSGNLLDSPDVECIWAVRQFCYLTHKVERPCAPERVASAFQQFEKTDQELEGILNGVSPEKMLALQDAFFDLFGELMNELETKVANFELIPRHGPGAVAEKLSPVAKREFAYWPERLERVFPHWRYTMNTPGWRVDHGVPIDSEIPVRVVAVPKTQSTPRIIAIEPAALQYAQQGLKREIYEYIGRGSLGKILGFTDQTRNQEMAREASLSGDLATLDLSEASDRVSFDLVMSLVRKWPHVSDFIADTRSRLADVEGVGIVHLNKFASMGSALTFPIEAMVFTAIAFAAMREADNRPSLSMKQIIGRLSVYGDDIIVPTTVVAHVIDWLHLFGAKVNRTKSFWTGKFRESCGMEYYNGSDVTVVRLRQDLPRSREDAASIASLVDFRNRLYKAGLWQSVRAVDEELDSFIRIPYINDALEHHEPGFLGRISSNPQFLPRKVRYNRPLQKWEYSVPWLKAHSKTYVVDGEPGLLEWFHGALRQRDLVDRYASQERPTSFSIQRRWVDLV